MRATDKHANRLPLESVVVVDGSHAVTIPARGHRDRDRVGLGLLLLGSTLCLLRRFLLRGSLLRCHVHSFALRRQSPPGAVAAAGSLVIQRRAYALTVRALRARSLASFARSLLESHASRRDVAGRDDLLRPDDGAGGCDGVSVAPSPLISSGRSVFSYSQRGNRRTLFADWD